MIPSPRSWDIRKANNIGNKIANNKCLIYYSKIPPWWSFFLLIHNQTFCSKKYSTTFSSTFLFARLKFWSFERWTFLRKCFLFNHCIINGHALISLPTSSQSKSLGYNFVCLSVIAATYLSCIRWWIFSLIFIHEEIVIFGKANRSEASLFAILFSTCWMITHYWTDVIFVDFFYRWNVWPFFSFIHVK